MTGFMWWAGGFIVLVLGAVVLGVLRWLSQPLDDYDRRMMQAYDYDTGPVGGLTKGPSGEWEEKA